MPWNRDLETELDRIVDEAVAELAGLSGEARAARTQAVIRDLSLRIVELGPERAAILVARLEAKAAGLPQG